MEDTDRRPTVSRRGVLQAGALTALGAATASTGSAYVPPDPTEDRDAIAFDQFVGVNAFVDDPILGIKPVAGTVREYHNWYWDEGDDGDYPGYPDNEIKWAPSYAGGGEWDFDEYYERLAGDTNPLLQDVHVSPCVQRAPTWLQDAEEFSREDVPTDSADADPTDPQSYEAKAHHTFQFAARYGSDEVDEELLTLAPDQPEVTGASLLSYVEDWNEPNRWWDGEDAEFSPEAYAAMSSAAYDGHAGTLEGPSGAYGVDAADSKMKFVMAGTAGIDLEWIQALDDWYAEHRPDGEFVPDVINVHHYCHSDGDDGPARSPEDDDLRGRMEAVTSWRDEHYPDVEVWLSEFGWDTHPESVLRPPDVPGFSLEQVQGQFLVRAYLELAVAGVDRAHAYMFRDVDPDDATQYSTCGLVTQKGDWESKPAWYYISTLRGVLRGERTLVEHDARDGLRVYRGADTDVYALWSPTTEGRTVENYELDVGANLHEQAELTGAAVVELADGAKGGVTTDLSPEDGIVTVDVGEAPVFVEVDVDEPPSCPGDGSVFGREVENSVVCDVDGDGNYMDVTGDGAVTNSDVVEFFRNQHAPPWNERADLFDFDGDDAVGQSDVIELFRHLVE